MISGSEWLTVVQICVSAGMLVFVGFGAVWLQSRLENLRLKQDVFRRVVGNVHGVLYDCRVFKDSHTYSESGIIAINEVRSVFNERAVLDAWKAWHRVSNNESSGYLEFAKLIRAMSEACKLKHYQEMELGEIADAFTCSCILGEQ